MVRAYKKNIIASKKTEHKRSLTCIIIIHRIWITTGRLRSSQNLVLFSIVNLYHRGSHSCLERRSLVILPCPYFVYYFLKMISIVQLLTNQNEFYWLFTIESTDFCLRPKSVNTSAKNFHFQVWLVGIRITWSLLLNAKLTSTSGKKWLNIENIPISAAVHLQFWIQHHLL